MGRASSSVSGTAEETHFNLVGTLTIIGTLLSDILLDILDPRIRMS